MHGMEKIPGANRYPVAVAVGALPPFRLAP